MKLFHIYKLQNSQKIYKNSINKTFHYYFLIVKISIKYYSYFVIFQKEKTRSFD